MSFQHEFSRQVHVFSTAILDDCDRALRPEQSDTMVLRLRSNALALAKVQLAMVAIIGTEPPKPAGPADRLPEDARTPDRLRVVKSAAEWPTDPDDLAATGPAAAPAPDDLAVPQTEPSTVTVVDDEDARLLAGDALSRFVSGRLAPDQSPHEAWQHHLATASARQPRNPALPRAGFRSASG
jgi:hypothetical protein